MVANHRVGDSEVVAPIGGGQAANGEGRADICCRERHLWQQAGGHQRQDQNRGQEQRENDHEVGAGGQRADGDQVAQDRGQPVKRGGVDGEKSERGQCFKGVEAGYRGTGQGRVEIQHGRWSSQDDHQGRASHGQSVQGDAR